jgi:ABC-2 type transport system permease protein
LQDPAWVLANLGNPDAIMARLGTAWPPSLFAYRAMSAPLSGSSVLWTLANLALGLGAAVLVVAALGPTFVASLRGFGERRFKRLANADSFLSTRLVARPAFLTLFRREFVLMNREPMYLLNGPFIVVLMPLILGIMFMVQKDALAEEFGFLGTLSGGSAGMLIAAGAAAFLGAGTSIACTAVSRDAKMLAGVKALPVSPTAYFLAKLAHAEAFGVFGAVVGAGLVGYALKLSLPDALLGGLVGLVFSTLVNLGGLYLDMAMPKLRWENPISALKQNMNSVITILGAMALIGGLGWLSTKLSLDALGMAALYGGGSLVLVAALLAAFPAWSKRRFVALEP